MRLEAETAGQVFERLEFQGSPFGRAFRARRRFHQNAHMQVSGQSGNEPPPGACNGKFVKAAPGRVTGAAKLTRCLLPPL